jgi:hypothetical protein
LPRDLRPRRRDGPGPRELVLGPPNRRLAVASPEGAAQQAVEADEGRSSHGGSSRRARRWGGGGALRPAPPPNPNPPGGPPAGAGAVV